MKRFAFGSKLMISLLAICLCMTMTVPALALDPSTLYNGSTGEEVRALQQKLIDLGYLEGTADGIFGNKTEKAVRRFQWKNRMSADGLAGKKTLAALNLAQGGEKAPAAETAAAAAPATAPTAAPAAAPATAPATRPAGVKNPSTLYNGCTGDAVLALQQKLIDLGYLGGTADGKFGDETEKAVRNFQQKNGLKADGLAGKKTMAALGKARNDVTENQYNNPTEVFTPGAYPDDSDEEIKLWDKMDKRAREVLKQEGYSTEGLNYVKHFFSPKSQNKSRDYYSVTFYQSRDTHEFDWTYAVDLSAAGKLLQMHARTENTGKMNHNNDPRTEDADPNLLSQARAAAKAFLKKYGYTSYASRVDKAEPCQISVSPDGKQVEYHLFDTNQDYHIRVQVLPTVKVENFNEQ